MCPDHRHLAHRLWFSQRSDSTSQLQRGAQSRQAPSSGVNDGTNGFAEGNGKAGPKERRRYFRIAKGSALETAAAFDVGFHFGVIAKGANANAQDLCDHLAAMLHRYR